MGQGQRCSHSGANYDICCIIAKTLSITCSEPYYQHAASDLAPRLCSVCKKVGHAPIVIVPPPIKLLFVPCQMQFLTFSFSSLEPQVGSTSYYAVVEVSMKLDLQAF